MTADTSASPGALLRCIREHRGLLYQITQREVVGRYKGSLLGIGWSLLNPLLMLAVFTFVFSVVFQARWGVGAAGEQEGRGVFALVLFIGLMIHSLFAEVLTRSPLLVTGNVNYVKKVIFPLQILPVSALLTALFHFAISLLVWLAGHLLVLGLPHWTAVYLPLVLLPLLLLSLGVAFVLASLGVFLRDIAQTMGLVATVLLFLSPIFFPLERMPESYQPLLLVNPLTFIIQQARDVLVWGRMPDLQGLAIYAALASLVLVSGFAWFQKTRKGFADVL